MVRIRYSVKVETGELVSKEIESPQGVLRARILRSETGWQVWVEKAAAQDVVSWVTVSSPEFTKNLSVAKNKAKKAIKELGVHFLEEVRRRG